MWSLPYFAIRWKTLFYAGQFHETAGPQHASSGPNMFYKIGHNLPVPQLENMEHAKLVELMANEKAWRVMFVRNPYARLLSGFLDKARPSKDPGSASSFLATGMTPPENVHKLKKKTNNFMGAPYEYSPSGFHKFVSWLVHHKRHVVDSHFVLQTDKCGITSGFEYDLYLKVEDMVNWYEDMVLLLGLERHVEFGWNMPVSGRLAFNFFV